MNEEEILHAVICARGCVGNADDGMDMPATELLFARALLAVVEENNSWVANDERA